MSYCQSLNKAEVKIRFTQNGKRKFSAQVSDNLKPVFARHVWGDDGDCKRCFKSRNTTSRATVSRRQRRKAERAA